MQQLVAFDDPRELGMLVRSVRRAHGYSQVRAADELGISQRYLSELERGQPKIFDERFLRVLASLGIRLQARVDGL